MKHFYQYLKDYNNKVNKQFNILANQILMSYDRSMK
jgi:hypothetical protein